jgi:hypothetical protein
MTTAEEVLEVTRRIHALAATPAGAMMTRAELERLAEQQLAVEKERAVARDKEQRQ